MFGTMISLRGGPNNSYYIHARFRGDKYMLHHQTLIRTILGLVVSKYNVSPPTGSSTFLIMTEAWTCLPWFRQQPTQF